MLARLLLLLLLLLLGVAFVAAAYEDPGDGAAGSAGGRNASALLPYSRGLLCAQSTSKTPRATGNLAPARLIELSRVAIMNEAWEPTHRVQLSHHAAAAGMLLNQLLTPAPQEGPIDRGMLCRQSVPAAALLDAAPAVLKKLPSNSLLLCRMVPLLLLGPVSCCCIHALQGCCKLAAT
jgi:hypothetical protein